MDLTDAAIHTIITHAPGLAGAFNVAYLEPVGGAAGRVDPEATAFAHRDAAYSFHILAGWMDASQDEEATAWDKAFHEAMASHSMGGVYVNLLARVKRTGFAPPTATTMSGWSRSSKSGTPTTCSV